MTTTDKDFIVAIELGSSKITGIAGKKKDGTMQVIAYAEEKTTACVKRGIVYNIEKTYQSVNTVINKLESVLKTKITHAYVGLSGQSVRSYRCIIRRNMLTSSYITNEAIDAIRQESYEIPYSDCEVLENIPQEYKIDQNIIADPVGVMGTNIEGEFLDVIAKSKLRNNIATVFANTAIDIADELISPIQLANNILSDSEKRSGCVLVDLGADTTTVVIYKNNIVRYLVTLPLGMNNVNKDLATIQVEESEAEEIKIKYANMETRDVEETTDDTLIHTTADGRKIEVSTIRNIIYARVSEIIANVNNQIIKSNYSEILLGGIILTGGGANMKGIDKAFLTSTNLEKCRIAKSLTTPIVKTSSATGFYPDNATTNTLISLLLAGTQSCGGAPTESLDLFTQSQQDEERNARLKKLKEQEEQEKNDAIAFDEVKTAIRDQYKVVQMAINELTTYGSDKAVRAKSRELSLNALEVLGDHYQETASALEGKDKFKQSLKEGADLATMLEEEVEKLKEAVKKADKENSLWGRITRTLDDIVNSD